MTNTEGLIDEFLTGLPEPKRGEMRMLHELVLRVQPSCRLWFSDGRNDDGKVVTNPSIGYGSYTIRYADGKTKESFRIGLSSNSSGISVYILGLADKGLLNTMFGATIGKANVTGYCIKFRRVNAIDLGVLQAAVRFGLEFEVNRLGGDESSRVGLRRPFGRSRRAGDPRPGRAGGLPAPELLEPESSCRNT